MRKIIYFLLTCLILVGVIYGVFQLYFSYRTLEEGYLYKLAPSPYSSSWFEAEIANIGEHWIQAEIVEQSVSEQNLVRTISAPISEKTIIRDKNGNPIDFSSLAVGQKIRICVMNGVIYEDAVHTDTCHHETYIGCYEISIID